MIAKNKLFDAFRLVNDFKSMDIRTKTFNTFPLSHYRVPTVDGIHFGEHGKGIDKVKQYTLEYIIFNLHNADEDMIIEAIIVLLYYWKTKKKKPKEMKCIYDKIIAHYTVVYDDIIPNIDIHYQAVVYSVSFCIGSIHYNKFGYATDKNRFIKMISDIKSKYPHVSVGSFKVHQLIQFDDEAKAKSFEEEALTNLKQHKAYKKCKCLFDGYKEAYLHT